MAVFSAVPSSSADDYSNYLFMLLLKRIPPDIGEFVFSEDKGMSDAENFLIAGGCCGAGIAVAGRAGLAVTELAAGGEPSYDLSAFSPGRFGAIDPFGIE